MTSRDRFRLTMAMGRPDRPPWLEEGMRDDVLAAWQTQGLPPDRKPASLFEYDRRERIEPDLSPRPPLPLSALVRGEMGELERALDADDPARLPADWSVRVKAWKHRDHILDLYLYRGLFLTLGVHDWASLEPVMEFLADDPSRAARIMEIQGRFAARMARRILDEVELDMVSLSEPIGGNNGPMVSPAMYRRIVLAGLAPVIEVLRGAGVPAIVFMTYANARALLPDVVAAGFNCLWAMETECRAMDYLDLRHQFGRELRLIGGIDLDCLLSGPAEIQRHMLAVVPALLEQGGYIPLADGRVRANIPLASYRCYREMLRRLTSGG